VADPLLIVTGMPRSGTSMMMFILRELGLPVLGEQFPTGRPRPVEGNPTGYWEHPAITAYGLFNDDLRSEAANQVVKIMLPGILHQPPSPTILMLRHPLAMATSMQTLRGVFIRPDHYVSTMRRFMFWFAKHRLPEGVLPVVYDDVIASPDAEIQRIVSHFKLAVSGQAIETAAQAVSPPLNRTVTDTWPDGIDGRSAEAIWQQMMSLRRGERTPERRAEVRRRVMDVLIGIGDRYKANLHRAFGGIPCDGCEAERIRLNAMTPEQVRAEFDQIVDATIQRAKMSPRWWDRIRAKVGDAVAPEQVRAIVGECLQHAIQ